MAEQVKPRIHPRMPLLRCPTAASAAVGSLEPRCHSGKAAVPQRFSPVAPPRQYSTRRRSG
jgi:hypothetical protein